MTLVVVVTLFLNKILNILEKSIQCDNISSKTTLVLSLCKRKYFFFILKISVIAKSLYGKP